MDKIRELEREVDELKHEIGRLWKKLDSEDRIRGVVERYSKMEMDEKWQPLLAAAKAIQLDDDMDSDVALMKSIAACEKE